MLLVVDTTEEYYVLKEEMLTKLEDLKDYKEQLLSCEPLRLQLDRQLCVFKPSAEAARFELPNDFYNLTAEEIKREQRLRWGGLKRGPPLPGGPAVTPSCLFFMLKITFYLKDRSSGKGFNAEDKSHERERRTKGNEEVQLYPVTS